MQMSLSTVTTTISERLNSSVRNLVSLPKARCYLDGWNELEPSLSA
jgi:hypothetical protein